MYHIYHNQQEKELLQYSDYLSKADIRLKWIQSACILVGIVLALGLMVTSQQRDRPGAK